MHVGFQGYSQHLGEYSMNVLAHIHKAYKIGYASQKYKRNSIYFIFYGYQSVCLGNVCPIVVLVIEVLASRSDRQGRLQRSSSISISTIPENPPSIPSTSPYQ